MKKEEEKVAAGGCPLESPVQAGALRPSPSVVSGEEGAASRLPRSSLANKLLRKSLSYSLLHAQEVSWPLKRRARRSYPIKLVMAALRTQIMSLIVG